jgi:hypothetical protein
MFCSIALFQYISSVAVYYLTKWTPLQFERAFVATTHDPAKHCHLRQRFAVFVQTTSLRPPSPPTGVIPWLTTSDHVLPQVKQGPLVDTLQTISFNFGQTMDIRPQDSKFTVHTTVQADAQTLFRTGGKPEYSRGEMGSREFTFVPRRPLMSDASPRRLQMQEVLSMSGAGCSKSISPRKGLCLMSSSCLRLRRLQVTCSTTCSLPSVFEWRQPHRTSTAIRAAVSLRAFDRDEKVGSPVMVKQ